MLPSLTQAGLCAGDHVCDSPDVPFHTRIWSWVKELLEINDVGTAASVPNTQFRYLLLFLLTFLILCVSALPNFPLLSPLFSKNKKRKSNANFLAF